MTSGDIISTHTCATLDTGRDLKLFEGKGLGRGRKTLRVSATIFHQNFVGLSVLESLSASKHTRGVGGKQLVTPE